MVRVSPYIDLYIIPLLLSICNERQELGKYIALKNKRKNPQSKLSTAGFSFGAKSRYMPTLLQIWNFTGAITITTTGNDL